MSKIVVIGSANVDLIMKMPRLPRVGETVTDAVFAQVMGGKGANQAVAAARAGGVSGAVAFVSCVGDDAYGAQVIEAMRATGIDTAHVTRERDTATGAALIMIGEAGQNYLSVAPGANYLLNDPHLDRAQPLFENAGLVMLQYEVSPDATAKAIRRLAALGKPIMFNLAPARPLAADLIAHIAYLVVNETEAEYLTGIAVTSDASCEAAAQALLEKGAGMAVITLGAAGVYARAKDAPPVRVPGFEVDAIDTTAAGDTFCGAFAVALLEKRPLPDALRFANAAAAISVTRLGAQPSIPTRAEIDAFLTVRGERPSFA
jgi:ribokinase